MENNTKNLPSADVVIIDPIRSEVAAGIYHELEPLMAGIKKRLNLGRDLVVVRFSDVDKANDEGISARHWARGKGETNKILKIAPPRVWVISDDLGMKTEEVREKIKGFIYAVRSRRGASETPIIVVTEDPEVGEFIKNVDMRSSEDRKLFVVNPKDTNLVAAAIESVVLDPPKDAPNRGR